jgi:hypothetical protein
MTRKTQAAFADPIVIPWLEHRAQKWTRFCGNTMRHDKNARASDDDDQSSDALGLNSKAGGSLPVGTVTVGPRAGHS